MRSRSQISSRSASHCHVSRSFVTLTVVVVVRDRRRVAGLTDAVVEFGLIPPEHWHQPAWIDEEKASAARDEMAKNNVIYGGALTLTAAEMVAIALPFFQEAYRTYKDPFVLALVLGVDVTKIPEHVSLQFWRKLSSSRTPS